jgi:hypothetical protein
VRLSEDAWQSDQNQQPKQCLCRAFIEAHGKGAIYSHAFFRQVHGKEPCLSCVFQGGARQTAHVCRAFCSRRTTKGVPRRLASVPLVAFFCRASWKNARQRLSTVRCQTWRTAKGLYRAKCYRAPFAVRPDKKRTAKSKAAISRSDTTTEILTTHTYSSLWTYSHKPYL